MNIQTLKINDNMKEIVDFYNKSMKKLKILLLFPMIISLFCYGLLLFLGRKDFWPFFSVFLGTMVSICLVYFLHIKNIKNNIEFQINSQKLISILKNYNDANLIFNRFKNCVSHQNLHVHQIKSSILIENIKSGIITWESFYYFMEIYSRIENKNELVQEKLFNDIDDYLEKLKTV